MLCEIKHGDIISVSSFENVVIKRSIQKVKGQLIKMYKILKVPFKSSRNIENIKLREQQLLYVVRGEHHLFDVNSTQQVNDRYTIFQFETKQMRNGQLKKLQNFKSFSLMSNRSKKILRRTT